MDRHFAREAEVDMLVGCERAAGDDRLLRNRGQIAVDRACRQRFGFDPRQRQQLVDEMRGALDAGVEIIVGRKARRLIVRAARDVQLQLECGKRCAKLVRGVGGEPALRAER